MLALQVYHIPRSSLSQPVAVYKDSKYIKCRHLDSQPTDSQDQTRIMAAANGNDQPDLFKLCDVSETYCDILPFHSQLPM